MSEVKPEEEIIVVEEEESPVGEINSTEEDNKEKKPVKRRGSDGNSKRGNDSQKRINELWAKRKEAEQSALNEKMRADNERARNQEYEKITASALEENLNTKRELLTLRLERAQNPENYDPKEVAKITSELSKIDAQAAQIDRYKIESQINKPNQKTQELPPQQEEIATEDIYEKMSPSGKKWLDDNRNWYDPSGEEYDEEKAADITYYARTLENEYISSGKGAQIGTRAYFKEIDDYIKNHWGEEMEEEQPKSGDSKRNYAAPVGNRNSFSNPTPKKEYKVTSVEKEMALSLEGKDKNGKNLSDADKIKRFVMLRDRVPNSGPISMKTLNKGN